ncbi:MAG: hypothetical protein ACKOGJ_07675, partial [Phycisphaerales bacterium]
PDLLGEAQLARLQRMFESVPPDLRRLDLGAERLMWIDLEQRLFTDDGRGNGWFRLDRDALLPLFGTVESSSRGMNDIVQGSATQAASLAAVTLSGPAAALIVADRRTTHEFFEHWAARIEASSALPLRDHAKVAALDREVHDAVSMDPVRLLLPRLLMPALGRASVTMAVDQARCEAVAAVCAVLRFRADTGSWPTRGEDLVPKYLPSATCTGAPLDPWTGTPIRVASNANGFRMWSVGEDGRDDGGDPTAVDDPSWGGARATMTALRRDDRNALNWPGEIPRIDWVWFAPTGTLDRWLAATSE